jgi:branched-chain amino acid transport system substrate-binding protein
MLGVTVGGDLPEFHEVLKKNAEFVYGATQWDESLPYPGAKEFAAAFKKKFKRDPAYHAAAGYAGCLIYAEGVKRAKTLDADKVRAELLALKTRTAFGDYAVDQDGFQTAHKMVTLQWQDGKILIVWPDELSNGKARFPMPPWSQR